ncbi:MAG: RluA family pseudouridine synthase, partial [Christensenellales bacterium]
MIHNFDATQADRNKRLDVFLSEKLPDFSRSQISQLNSRGKVFVNGKAVKNGFKLSYNDKIEIDVETKKEKSFKPENISLDVVYEDDDLIVINKPQGLCVHPAIKNEEHTLVNALMFRFKNLSDVNGSFRMGIVHRLDKDTSGLMVCAKNNKAHANLAKQIQTKTCKRKYLALVVGSFKESEGVIDKNLIRSKKNRLKFEVCPSFEGKTAITHYKTLEVFRGYSLVEFELKTGRTHQIRVHSAFLGHPIVGDKLYGVKDNFDLSGQLLTSHSLTLTQPSTGEILHFEIPLPQYFEDVLNKLRQNVC